jgi:hypothetical protein
MTETKPQDDAKTAEKDEEEVKDDEEDEEAKIEAPSGTKEETKDGDARDFPDAFYCPITKEVMTDPVVLPDGDSYEKAAIVARGDVPSNKLYPNRALQAIIEETVEMNGDSMRAGLMRFQRSMRKSFSQLLDKSAMPSMEYRDLPDSYYGPITFSLIHNPAIDPEGNTYERAAIENWIQANHTSPITRTSASVDDLYPNNAISALLEEEKGKSEGSIHPSIRKWKEEGPPPTSTSTPSDPEVGGAARFPTTQAGLDEMREQHRRAVCTILGLILFIAFVILSFVYSPIFLVLFLILWLGAKDNIRNQQRNRE